MKNWYFPRISLSVNFKALDQKATMSELIKRIIWSYFEIFILIGLWELRGINSKNGVSSIESVIFHHGIILGMIRETL